MDRRSFFRSASLIGISAAVTGRASQRAASALCSAAGGTHAPNDTEATILADEGSVIKNDPPPAVRPITRENREKSQENMRWAMQHWRELYPTQRVRRSKRSMNLPRAVRDVKTLAFHDTTGQQTTVERQLAKLDVNAFVVLTGGKITFEDYRHGMLPDTPHFTASVYKSVVATVIGALIGEGTLKEENTIESYVPELGGTALEGATVRELLDMESGAKYDYVGPESAFARHNQSIGPDARALGVPVGTHAFLQTLERERNHGERLRYKEADPLALAWAAEKTTGQRFADLLQDRIWAKIGAEFDAEATCDPLGQWTFYLSLTLRDLARWGLMCLNEGMVKGQRVVPASFFEDIHANASVEKLIEAPLLGKFFPEGVGYRSFFYHHQATGAIAAAGAFGQFCYIDRKRETVLAFFSTTPPAPTGDSTTEKFEQGKVFEHACRLEWERWHLCEEIAKAAG